MRMRDELGTIFSDEQFYYLYSQRRQPGKAPWRLALITLMQFCENLTDRQAADSVRSRIDWKFVLGLELSDQRFHLSVLREFCMRLIQGHAEHLLSETLIRLVKDQKLLKTG